MSNKKKKKYSSKTREAATAYAVLQNVFQGCGCTCDVSTMAIVARIKKRGKKKRQKKNVSYE